MTGELYLQLLKFVTNTTSTDIIENDQEYDKDYLIFLQDSAPSHYASYIQQNVDDYLYHCLDAGGNQFQDLVK